MHTFPVTCLNAWPIQGYAGYGYGYDYGYACDCQPMFDSGLCATHGCLRRHVQAQAGAAAPTRPTEDLVHKVQTFRSRFRAEPARTCYGHRVCVVVVCTLSRACYIETAHICCI